jgi:general secretion pathway protein I
MSVRGVIGAGAMNIRGGLGARGFTLIEVLVALAIVTVGMAAVLATLTSSADTIVYLRDKTFANWVALNQIAQVRLSGQVPPTGKSDGDSDFAGRKWHWHQEVNSTQVPGMVRMDVSVRPADAETSDSDRGWYTTMSGITGDAVGLPRGDLPNWGAQTLTPGSNAVPGNPTSTPGTAPVSPQTPQGPPAPQTPQPGVQPPSGRSSPGTP